jgi:SAM-dependent methyltransferase
MVTTEIEAALRVLRPSYETVSEAWRTLVTAERMQVESLPNRPRPEDFYGPIATAFTADPRRTDEPLLDTLRSLVRQDETWIDIGAGGGRYTLPIALLAKKVYAVEPSKGMTEALTASAAHYGIDNLEVYQERWPGESAAPVADVSFISHVGYDIAEFGAFVQQMERHSSRLCVAVMFERAPISDFAPLWRHVHGEDRVLLPGMGEFLAMLFSRGRVPEIRLLDVPARTYESIEALHAATRRPTWVLEGSKEDERLAAAVRELAIEVEGGVRLSQTARHLGVISWSPR